MQTYPNDPHIDYRWPGGKSALSPKGSLQMYTLGTSLRRRYYRLLPSDGFYAAESMEIMSSPRERTLMSSQSFLAGFMPPPTDRNLLPIPWQPIAIHSIPAHLDHVSRKCVWLRIQVNLISFLIFSWFCKRMCARSTTKYTQTWWVIHRPICETFIEPMPNGLHI